MTPAPADASGAAPSGNVPPVPSAGDGQGFIPPYGFPPGMPPTMPFGYYPPPQVAASMAGVPPPNLGPSP